MSSPREYRDHVTECLDSAKSAKSDAERQIFLDMAKAWLETAVQAVIPTVSQQTAEPAPDAAAAVADFSVACANDNETPVNEVAGGAAAIAPDDDIMAAELPATKVAAPEAVVAEHAGDGADEGERVSADDAASGAGDEPPIQWDVVRDAALCPWGPSTSSYWPR